MRNKTAAAVLAASITLGGGAALVAPGFAFAADGATSSNATSATGRAAARLGAIENALKGLVTDGTLTQAQSDKVASTLASSDLGFGGRGRRGPHDGLGPVATAKVLGITPQALRDARESGKTLTQIAATKGISRADLITRLVAAAKTELADALKAGRITQAQHDRAVSTLSSRISAHVDSVGGPGRRDGHGDGDGDGPGAAPDTVAPAPTASTTS